MLCEDPSESVDCPKGYCPVASFFPQKCIGLEKCSGTGLRRFKVGTAAGLILFFLVISIVYLYGGRLWLRKKAKREQAKRESTDVLETLLTGDAAEVGTKKEEKFDDEGEAQLHSAVVDEAGVSATTDNTLKRTKSITKKPDMEIDIDFESLRLTIPGAGTIMRGVSGSLNHGCITAIMGPSGAGKTTFLSIISGKVDRTGGTLKVNGVEKELTSLRRVIGFVPQEDVMLRELTVEDNIRHSALMRLPRDWPLEKKLEQVEEIIESLEIGHIRDSVVGDEKRRGISGGQRKRVNIALEMVMKPSLLCLDEPTSGLDSTTSQQVLLSLKEMAGTGVNVVAVLHQPKYEIFKLFDQVLLLGKGGMTVYHGPADGMTEYFEKRGFPCPERENPADYYMDVVSGIIPHATDPDFDKESLFETWMCAEENPAAVTEEEAKEQMKKNKEADLAENEKEKPVKGDRVRAVFGCVSHFFARRMAYCLDLKRHIGREFNSELRTTRETPGFFKQTQLLLKRAMIQRLRNPTGTVINIVLMIVAGSIIPGLVGDNVTLYVGIPNNTTESTSAQEAYFRQNVNPVDAIPTLLNSIYFFLLIVSCLSVTVLGSERTVFFRDSSSGQLVFSYWIAKTFEAFAWLPIYTAAFVMLGYSSDAWLIQPLSKYFAFLLFDLVGFFGFGMLASLLVGPGSAALMALVFGLIVAIGFSGTITAIGDMSSGMQAFTKCWFLFWSTQGICSSEYDMYTYAFDIERLNAETPDSLATDFGEGESVVGAGVGKGFDLSDSYSKNLGICAVTAFIWHIVVLWVLKTKDYKKQR
jgi:ABC-type multidrug transport system ATPase subunit